MARSRARTLLACGLVATALSCNLEAEPVVRWPAATGGQARPGGLGAFSYPSSPTGWGRLGTVSPGERLDVTLRGAEHFAAVFITSSADSLTVAELSQVPDEKARDAVARVVRERPGHTFAAGVVEARGRKARIVSLSKDDVARVTVTRWRSSKSVTTVATAAAAVGGVFLGAAAGISAGGGLLNPKHEGTGTAVFFAIAIGLPVGVGLAVHSATRRSYTDVVYEAQLPPVASQLGEADWQAARRLLPPSFRTQ